MTRNELVNMTGLLFFTQKFTASHLDINKFTYLYIITISSLKGGSVTDCIQPEC